MGPSAPGRCSGRPLHCVAGPGSAAETRWQILWLCEGVGATAVSDGSLILKEPLQARGGWAENWQWNMASSFLATITSWGASTTLAKLSSAMLRVKFWLLQAWPKALWAQQE